MGGIDVATVLAQYEDQPVSVPMHGQQGQVRRNPSTDQRKVRREMTKKATEDQPTDPDHAIAQLLRQASRETDYPKQVELIAEAERLKGEKRMSHAASRALDLTPGEAVEIIPNGTHELHTASTDWLLDEGLHATASATEAEHELVAQASLWYGQVPAIVKEDEREFAIQATGKARYLASQFGEHADDAAAAFITEARRLYRQEARFGGIKATAALIHDLDDPNGGMVDQPLPGHPGPVPGPQNPEQPQAKPGPHLDAHVPVHAPGTGTPHLDSEVDRLRSGSDAEGVGGMAREFAHQQVNGSLQKAASATEGDDLQLAQVLAGFTGEAASTVPQVGAQGLPQDQFSTLAPATVDPLTTSERSPALQEIESFTGWDGTSVVPQGNNGAEAANNDTEPTRDFASSTPGFPVSGSMAFQASPGSSIEVSGLQLVNSAPQTHAAKVAAQLTKETTMEHAQCPTCGGHGKVAVRKQAYSGLPQIDQIVNADETPGATELPTPVAFPLTGWGETPQQGAQNVQNAIQETEGLISERNAKSPLATTGGYVQGYDQSGRPAAHVANGRDNSGWMGDMGAKGTDYPGYSTPVGYDGSSNLGQPDPVYGYGGDQGNRPLRPYGEEEANDVTNNPQEPYDPSQPHNNDQAYRQVSPQALTTQGSHPDPFIAQAQADILAAQRVIATRNAMAARQAG